ncbi:MAG: DUF3417 domain-containing protein, partial [Bacteroidales bacterium]|nr:DUF3417 domain-containing protein [Bacteroidales bacterium]
MSPEIKRNLQEEQPVWKKIIVESHLPDSLYPLRELSRNLWWVWNNSGRELFEYIDKNLWKEKEHNPVFMLAEVNYKRFQELENDEYFISEMHKVFDQFNRYIDERKE